MISLLFYVAKVIFWLPPMRMTSYMNSPLCPISIKLAMNDFMTIYRHAHKRDDIIYEQPLKGYCEVWCVENHWEYFCSDRFSGAT